MGRNYFDLYQSQAPPLDKRREYAAILDLADRSAMQTFQWGRHFETGLDTVDEQHRTLVSLINRLGASFLAGQTQDLANTFAQLVDYAKHHFSDEERLMRAANLAPEYVARHEEIHAQFGEQLSLLWQSRDATGDTGETLLGFLVAWLGFHILGEDQDMASQVAAIRAGAAPATAFAQAGEGRGGRDGRTAALIDALQGLYRTLSLQNRELANANQRLEGRVAERTRDLAASNDALREAYERMESLARVDGLLGIANRRHFDERFDIEWRRAQRSQSPLGLLMIDVDHFKLYNDAYGHQAGDDCLKAVTGCIAGGRRPGDLLARYGGEELVLLLPETPAGGALKVAREVCAAVAHARIAHRASPVAGHVTVSVGVAVSTPGGAEGAAQLLVAADRALYAAKAQGRNRAVAQEGA